MTNIIENKYTIKQGILNPKSASYFFPSLSGFLLSTLTGLFILRPLMIETNEIYEELIISKTKVSLLESAEKRYKITKLNLSNINNQKEDLLSLVAGESELITLLDQLNILAKNNNINIKVIKPKEIQYIIPTGNNLEINIDRISDPLLNEHIIKYPYEIEIEGRFEKILLFFRDLEKLEVITELSNLEIAKLNANNKLNLQTSFMISAYGRNYQKQ